MMCCQYSNFCHCRRALTVLLTPVKVNALFHVTARTCHENGIVWLACFLAGFTWSSISLPRRLGAAIDCHPDDAICITSAKAIYNHIALSVLQLTRSDGRPVVGHGGTPLLATARVGLRVQQLLASYLRPADFHP